MTTKYTPLVYSFDNNSVYVENTDGKRIMLADVFTKAQRKKMRRTIQRFVVRSSKKQQGPLNAIS